MKCSFHGFNFISYLSFTEEDIDGRSLLLLTKEDFAELKLKLGPRKKMEMLIQTLRATASPISHTMPSIISLLPTITHVVEPPLRMDTETPHVSHMTTVSNLVSTPVFTPLTPPATIPVTIPVSAFVSTPVSSPIRDPTPACSPNSTHASSPASSPTHDSNIDLIPDFISDSTLVSVPQKPKPKPKTTQKVYIKFHYFSRKL